MEEPRRYAPLEEKEEGPDTLELLYIDAIQTVRRYREARDAKRLKQKEPQHEL